MTPSRRLRPAAIKRRCVLAPRFVSRPAVFVGLLARMVQSGRADLIGFVVRCGGA